MVFGIMEDILVGMLLWFGGEGGRKFMKVPLGMHRANRYF